MSRVKELLLFKEDVESNDPSNYKRFLVGKRKIYPKNIFKIRSIAASAACSASGKAPKPS